MNRAFCKRLGSLWFCAWTALALCSALANESYVATRSLPAPEASQAAAADEHSVFAVGNAIVAKYDRATGERLALSSGSAKHLNSAYLLEGKLYCAHSNYPQTPEKSEIMVLEPETMRLGPFKNFGQYRGSLTWCVKEAAHWWCTFARYGKDNADTTLVKFDAEWRELASWIYPPEVIRELGQYSISGGLWKDGRLLVTGHDRRVIYRLRVPEKSGVLELIDTLPSPFPGQGIAADPLTGGLLGIDRAKKTVVFAEPRS